MRTVLIFVSFTGFLLHPTATYGQSASAEEEVPSEVGLWYDVSYPVFGAAVDGKRVFIAGLRQTDLIVLALGPDAEPERTVTRQAFRGNGGVALAARSGMVLAAVDVGLRIFAVPEEGPLQVLSTVESDVLQGHSRVMAVSPHLVALSHSRPQPEGSDSVGVSLVDLNDMSTPSVVGTIELPLGSDNVAQMVLADSVLFVAAGTSGLFVFDVGDPLAVRLLSQYTPGSWTRGVATANGFVYITVAMTQGSSWLQTLDVSDPTNPRVVDSQDTPGIAQRLAQWGPFLYVAARNAGLRIYDISQAGQPQFTTGYRLRASDVVAADSFVVIWDWAVGSAQILRHLGR